MRKIILLLLSVISIIAVQAQNVQTATNGLYHTPTTGTTVRVVGLGGTLTQATTVDLGASFTFGIKKATANYFFINNAGNIGIGNILPTTKLDVTGVIKSTGLVLTTTTPAPAAGKFLTSTDAAGTAAWSTTLNIANGGTGLTAATAAGDMWYADVANATAFTKLPIGTSGQVLTVSPTLKPVWASAAGGTGTITSVFGRTGVVVAAANDYTFAQISTKPTTLLGYGITDAALSSHVHAIDALSNVTITTAANNQVLTYNSTTSKWVNQAAPAGAVTTVFGRTGVVIAAANDYTFAQIGTKPTTILGYGITDAALSSHVHAMDALSNVTIASPTDGQVLTYNTAIGKWKNQAAAAGGTSQWTTTASNIYFNTGLVMLGTAINPNAADANLKLAVNGNIYAKKVKVTQLGWADYVFAPEYVLPTLSQVEKFIQANKHLPNLPSAAEVEKNGIDLGDNQAKLLQKIEELTLYAIDANKKIETQQTQMQQQAKQIKLLQEAVKKMQNNK